MQEGEEPIEPPAELLAEHARLADQLGELVLRINRTNLDVTLADGRSLTAALARRDALRLLIAARTGVADAASARADRFTRSEVRYIAAIDVASVRAEIDGLSKEWRELDVRIQEANWAHELI